MGVGHVPQDPLRPQGAGADVQGRQRGRAAGHGDLSLSRQARGRWGEDRAAAWYAAAGYEVVARNWRGPGRVGEIDLIVAHAATRTIVFAEVKARAAAGYGVPAEAVTFTKRQRIRRLAAIWLADHDVHGVNVRFDVVAVLGTDITVIEGAF